jgi:hypothetical protein
MRDNFTFMRLQIFFDNDFVCFVVFFVIANNAAAKVAQVRNAGSLFFYAFANLL